MIGIVIAEFLRSWSFNKGKLYELFTPKFAIGAHAAHVDIFAVFYVFGDRNAIFSVMATKILYFEC